MFGFFKSANVSELEEEKKALLARVKENARTIENLREQISDMEHNTYRYHREEIRNLSEKLSDMETAHARDLAKVREHATETAKAEVKDAKAAFQKTLESKDETIAELRSEIRDLNLAAEESAQNIDLAIREGILEYTEKNLGEIAKLQVQVAELKGDIKAAKAEADAKGIVIKALEKQNEVSASQVADSMAIVRDVAPKVNLEKLGFEITVPAQAKQGGGEQKKQ